MKPSPLTILALLLPPPTTANTSPPPHNSNTPSLRAIAIEEHWASPALADLFITTPLRPPFPNPQQLIANLLEVGPSRLASMDAGAIHIQVISHVPTAAAAMFNASATRLANAQLAARIAATNPLRFRGFCVLPMALPAEAAAQLEICVRDHGFVGALVDAIVAHPNGSVSFFEGREYDVLWAAAVRLDVPVYLHPAAPAAADVFEIGGLYAPAASGSYSTAVAASLATAAWGWHEHAGLSFLRLYVGGVFEQFPGLQVVLGHMGEMVPYYLWRADAVLSRGQAVSLREVYKRNVWVAPSGIFSLEPMEMLLKVTDVRRVMYSVDWPFGRNEDGRAWMEALRGSGLVTPAEFGGIAYGNAKRLLKL